MRSRFTTGLVLASFLALAEPFGRRPSSRRNAIRFWTCSAQVPVRRARGARRLRRALPPRRGHPRAATSSSRPILARRRPLPRLRNSPAASSAVRSSGFGPIRRRRPPLRRLTRRSKRAGRLPRNSPSRSDAAPPRIAPTASRPNAPSSAAGWSPARPRSCASPKAVVQKPKVVEPTTHVVVFGDSLGELMSDGLSEAYEDAVEIDVVDRTKPDSGLVRNDHYDWAKAIGDYLDAQPQDHAGGDDARRQRPPADPRGRSLARSPVRPLARDLPRPRRRPGEALRRAPHPAGVGRRRRR